MQPLPKASYRIRPTQAAHVGTDAAPEGVRNVAREGVRMSRGGWLNEGAEEETEPAPAREPGSIGDTGPAVCNVRLSPFVADRIPVCLHSQKSRADRDNMIFPTVGDFIIQN
eukprot:12409728-Karenia_brevis.AAC.1